ncbi:hypothetical protein I4U23_001697 [Adineta vaga]|nr:hypothetical protein I4U23_001697 [Adineta vaga]
MCITNSSSSSSSSIFIIDLPSYGLIGLIIIGLILYLSYMIFYIRNHRHSSTTIYIFISQLSLLLVLLSSMTFLFRPEVSRNWICTIQSISLQIFPFFLLLGFNIHFAHQWLFKMANSSTKKTYLISLSSFLLFLLVILIQTGILIIWFYNYHNYEDSFDQCSNECSRPLFLCSLSLNFFLLFLFSFQSSIRYHLYNYRNDLIYLLTSLLALSITITWICLYLFSPIRSLVTFYINNNSILAFGNLFFVYTFLGPFLYEEVFLEKVCSSKGHVRNKSSKMTFKCLSLTKEQQRVFMAAYIKRNLTASCENLTSITISSPIPTTKQINSQTCHSTLSADSLCPTLISTISNEIPPKILPTIVTDASSCETLTSEYLLLSTSALPTNTMK